MKHLRAQDDVLAEAMDRVGLFVLELKPIDSLFEAMLRSIIYQQLHGSAAAAIHGRVLAELERHGASPRRPPSPRPMRPCAGPASPQTSCSPSAHWP